MLSSSPKNFTSLAIRTLFFEQGMSNNSIYKYLKHQSSRPRVPESANHNLNGRERSLINQALVNTPRPTTDRRKHAIRYSFNDAKTVANYARLTSVSKAATKYGVSEKTTRRWRSALVDHMKWNKHKKVSDLTARDLPQLASKPGGRPSTLSNALNVKVKEAVAGLRRGGVPVSKSVIAGVLTGVLRANRPGLLSDNGGSINPMVYARSFRRYRLKDWSFRVGSSKRRPSKDQSEAINQWRMRCEFLIERHKIPYALVLNLDQTHQKYVTCTDHTLDLRGSDVVRIAGLGDKRGVSQVMTCSADGTFLPIQQVYKGKFVHVFFIIIFL